MLRRREEECGLLIDYPVKFGDEEIPEPEEWSEESSVVENVNQTEAGTDQISVIRYDKLSVSCSFQCSHRWAGKFKAYSKKDSISVRMYDIELAGYKTRTMRIRSFKADPVKNSQRTPNTNGLWEISFHLEEF